MKQKRIKHQQLAPSLHELSFVKKGILGSDFIYVLGDGEGMVKIGMTQSLWSRVKQLRAMNPKKLELLMFWRCNSGKAVEAALHCLFRDCRCHGEWFRFGEFWMNHSTWRYRLLVMAALQTCDAAPIPINGAILDQIQYEHISVESERKEGNELHAPELFAGYFSKDEPDMYQLLNGWSDEVRQRYGFEPSRDLADKALELCDLQ
jgi:hypothetical protein